MMKRLYGILAAGYVLAAPLAVWAQEQAAETPAAAPDMGLALAKTVGGLILVLALLFGLVWILRRVSPAAGAMANGRFRMVAKLPLGPRKWLGLVELGGRLLVIGVSEAGIRHIETIEDPDLLQELSIPRQGFSKILQKARGTATDEGQ